MNTLTKIIILLIIIIITTSYIYRNKLEGYDNLIPNKLRYKIYESNNKDDFDNVWNECRYNCKRMGFSELGCLQSCREHIKDRLFYLKNRNRNYFITF